MLNQIAVDIDQGFLQFRTSALAIAALLLALDRSLFRHPGKASGPHSWTRLLNGHWHETLMRPDEPRSVTVALKGVGVVSAAQLMAEVCKTMHLDKVNRTVIFEHSPSIIFRQPKCCFSDSIM